MAPSGIRRPARPTRRRQSDELEVDRRTITANGTKTQSAGKTRIAEDSSSALRGSCALICTRPLHPAPCPLFLTLLPASCSRPARPADSREASARQAPDWFVDRAADAGLELRPFQRHVGAVLLRRDHRLRRRAFRLRQRRRSRRVPGPGPKARNGPAGVSAACAAPSGTALSERPDGQPGRHARVEVHRRHRREPHHSAAGTGWASPPATSTTTAASTCFSPTSDRTSSGGTTATGRSPTCRTRRVAERRCRGRRGDSRPSWSVSAAFLDFDRDGWLDLFVGNYLSYRVETNMPCFSPSGRPDYCSPNAYRPQASRLYHNNRDGTFSDVTAAAGMARDFGPALGVTTADFNGDGWIDIFVANDGQPNQLWINQRDGTFRNLALLSGTAMNPHGKAKAGMGVDAGDFDNDGDEDLRRGQPARRGRRLVRQRRLRRCSKHRASVRALPPPASRSPGSARRGSTSTTTAGSTRSSSTARCRRSSRSARPTIRFRCTRQSCCSETSATAASRTSPAAAGPRCNSRT